MRASSFREDEHRDMPFLNDLRSGLHRLDGRARVASGNRNVPGLAEMGAKQRDFEQAALGDKPELHLQIRHDHGSIHVAEMVGRENVASIRVDVLQAFHPNVNSASPKK